MRGLNRGRIFALFFASEIRAIARMERAGTRNFVEACAYVQFTSGGCN
jgi:hypothetical protein